MRRTLACLGSLSLVAGKVYFSETFPNDNSWEKRWTKSEWKKAENLQGDWRLNAGKYYRDAEEHSGLQTAEDSKFFGISTEFPSFSNENKDLYIQYQVKFEKDVECGGAYLKVGPKMNDPADFGDGTKYNIMFGPDECGYTKRTQVIFHHKGKTILKKTDIPYKQTHKGISHLYRLVVKPDNTVIVEIDGEEVFSGNLIDDWEMLHPKELPDAKDRKPDDWHDDAEIEDPEESMPDDWVEEKRMVDTTATQPDYWDEEEDGEWEPPMKDNPSYKGKWEPKKVPNPNYVGYWEARRVNNPEYEEDDNLYRYLDFSFIGFDLWQIRGGTIFDNIIVCDEEAEADAFEAKWKVLNRFEKDEVNREENKGKVDTRVHDQEDDDDDEDHGPHENGEIDL